MKLLKSLKEFFDPDKQKIKETELLDHKIKMAKNRLELAKIRSEKKKELDTINIEIEKLK